MSHFIEKCKHGKVVSQCRCIDQNKTVRIVKCPTSCPEFDTPTTHSEYLELTKRRDMLFGELEASESHTEALRQRYYDMDNAIEAYEDEQRAWDE